jgi:hypothetical protein
MELAAHRASRTRGGDKFLSSMSSMQPIADHSGHSGQVSRCPRARGLVHSGLAALFYRP